MPLLTIDNRKIEVPRGTKVIDAAERLGIMIPRFCYHEALGSVGACRLCAVKFEDGPVKGIQMSCMVKAMDGMVVSTVHPEAVEFRRQVIEWLMVNHPHDCPVCDEGGHCLLQDETISGGHGRRRYQGAKRTYHDQDLGPLVRHEMNRCIHCYRCVRFYREYAGYRDLGVLGIASRTYFGRCEDGPLESPFSGNLIDICPTGVFTDKPARFKARHWDLERSASVCLHCSLGCHTTASARYREIIRLEARPNPKGNGFFICDRGRYGFGYANLPERPRLAEADGRGVTRQEALALTAERLQGIIDYRGPRSVALLGSTRNSLETQLALAHLCRDRGWRPPVFFIHGGQQRAVTNVLQRLDQQLAATLPDLEKADLLVAVGLDPLNEVPMLALAMRQAARHQARLVVIDPRPVRLPCRFDHVAAPLPDLAAALAVLVKHGVSKGERASGPELRAFLDGLPDSLPDPLLTSRLRELAVLLAASQHPAILCGSRQGEETLASLALNCALLLRDIKGECLFFLDPEGPNALGAALLGEPETTFETTLQAIEADEIKALLVVKNDPLYHYPDRGRLQQALDKLDLLVVLDYLNTPFFNQAHIRLPVTTVFEAGGTFVNHAGILQYAAPACQGGMPIRQAGQGGHPPRLFSNAIPFGEPQSAFRTLLTLGEHLGMEPPPDPDTPWSLLPDDFPGAAKLRDSGYPADGVSILEFSGAGPAFGIPPFRPAPGRAAAGDELVVLAVATMFGTEELSAHAGIIRQLAPEPRGWMHPDDAARINITDNTVARLTIDREEDCEPIELKISLDATMASGHFILPRHYRLVDRIASWPRKIRLDQLEPLNQKSKIKNQK